MKTLKQLPDCLRRVNGKPRKPPPLTVPTQSIHKPLACVVNGNVQPKPDCAELEKNNCELRIWLPERYKKLLQVAATRDDRELGAMARVILKKWLDAKD